MFAQRLLTGLGVLLSVMVSSAYAHKVNIFAYEEGGQVYAQGYFSDGTKAKNSEVTVFTGDGQELTKGQTDEDGAFVFATQGKPQALHIVLNAGMGHQATYDIPLDEVVGSAPTASIAQVDPAPAQTEQAAVPAVASEGPAVGISESQVRRAVAEGVLPLAREVSELKERRGFSDIVGGIGFIVGILGALAYVKARQETRRANRAKTGAGE